MILINFIYQVIKTNSINAMDIRGLLEKYKITIDPNFILERWDEPHRFFHNISFLDNLISSIKEDFGNGSINENEKDKLILTSLFHKLVFDPHRDDNEEKSAEIFYRFCGEKFNVDLVEVKQMILDVKTNIPCTPLSNKFLEYQYSICNENFEHLLEWEKSVREEQYLIEDVDYKRNRIKYLESCIEKYPMNIDNILDLINWIKSNYD